MLLWLFFPSFTVRLCNTKHYQILYFFVSSMFQTSLIVPVKIKNYLSKGEILAEESYYILVILLLDGQVLLFFISGAGLVEQ